MPTSDIKKGPLYVDSTNNRVGVGNAAPTTALDVTGTVTADGLTVDVSGGQITTETNGFIKSKQNLNVASAGGRLILSSNAGDLCEFFGFQDTAGSDAGGVRIRTNDGSSLKYRSRFDSNGDISFYEDTGTTAKFFWDASAEALGIGTTTNTTHSLFIHDSDYQQLGLSGTRPTIFLKETDGNANENYQIRLQNGNLQFETQNDAQTGASTRLAIDSSGGISKNGSFSYSGTSDDFYWNTGTGDRFRFHSGTTSSRDILGFSNPNGVVGSIETSGTSTSYNTSSDYRLKTAVTYDWDATSRLKQLRPARFEWIADGDDAVPVDGFLAHEVQTVVPEAITGTHNEVDDDGNPVYQGIDQSKLTPLLTKALIEAVEKIEQLEARIAALEAN